MKSASITALACVLTVAARAAIVVPGATGFDGDLNITADTVIDLSQAVTGTWNDPNQNPANIGKGVYDPVQWAVVFKYTNVTVAAGKTVTFKNHVSRAPVVWLVSGDVMIDGTVSLDGQGWQVPPLLAEPGPGGFRGGIGWYAGSVKESAGFGVGGGAASGQGMGGSYGTLGYNGSSIYGNPALIPLLGGSGGGGRGSSNTEFTFSGGGGGGAALIACAGVMNISGEIRANGGAGTYGSRSGGYFYSGSGSGGGIRLLAHTLSGSGRLRAVGGSGGYSGGSGRIRIERVTNSNTINVNPDPSVVTLEEGATVQIFPPVGAPEVKIVSIGGQQVPDDPEAAFGTAGADVALPQATSTTVVVETINVEEHSTLKVRSTPRSNGNFTEVELNGATNPSVRQTIQQTPSLIIRWTATLPVQVGSSAVQVRVIRP